MSLRHYTSANYSRGTCRITVDPSRKVANLNNKTNSISKERLAQLAKNITLGKVSPEKAIKYLVNVGYSEDKSTEWVHKYINKKNTIGLTESKLKKIITESVKNILNEEGFYADELYGLGADFENGQQGLSNKGPWWMPGFLNFEKRVNSGKYDEYIFDDDWIEEFIDEEYPNTRQEREMMEKCISNRRYELKNKR